MENSQTDNKAIALAFAQSEYAFIRADAKDNQDRLDLFKSTYEEALKHIR